MTDTPIRRNGNPYPLKTWPKIVPPQADVVFTALSREPGKGLHIDEIARETGLSRALVLRAISYLRNTHGGGFIVTEHHRHLSTYALADGQEQADAYIAKRIREEAGRLRTVAQQMQTRLQVFGPSKAARILDGDLTGVVNKLMILAEDDGAVSTTS